MTSPTPTPKVDRSHPTASPAADAPSGLRWRLTARLTARSRKRRYDLFVRELAPRSTDRILDVGVIDTAWRSSNFLEANYVWADRITAVGLEPMPAFENLFPSVRFVVADGRDLPFADAEFDIGFSNAVVEHVGSAAEQRRFIGELVRTCRRVFVATPNAAFPIDPHTLLPFVHWLPRTIRHPILRATGQARWASEAALHPLDAAELTSLFPSSTPVRIVRQRVMGLTTVLIAIAGDEGGAVDEVPGPVVSGEEPTA